MMARLGRTWGRGVGGWGLLSIAVVIFPVPILPTLLGIAGLLILSTEYDWARKLLHKAQLRFPSLFRKKTETIAEAKAL